MTNTQKRPLISCHTWASRWRAIRYYWGPRRVALREGRLKHNRMDSYWWTGEVNFGDQLTPELLRYYGFTPVLMPARRAKVVVSGSILEHMPETYHGAILGAGFIDPETNRTFAGARVLAVRGNLTRQRLGLPDDVPVGDPGLLIPRLAAGREAKRYELGIVPHYEERNAPTILRLQERFGTAAIIIDVQRPPTAVMADIDRCLEILASSLHGLITADALEIPNTWIMPGGGYRRSRFKYDDYYSALGVYEEPLELTGDESLTDLRRRITLKPDLIGEVQNALHRVFSDLHQIIPP